MKGIEGFIPIEWSVGESPEGSHEGHVYLDPPTETEVHPEKVEMFFGPPCSHRLAEGFWDSPKTIHGHGGQLELINPSLGWTRDNIRLAGIAGNIIFTTYEHGRTDQMVKVSLEVQHEDNTDTARVTRWFNFRDGQLEKCPECAPSDENTLTHGVKK